MMYCSVFTGRNLVAQKTQQTAQSPEYILEGIDHDTVIHLRISIHYSYLKQKNGGKLNEIMYRV